MGKSKEDDDRARIWSGFYFVDTGYREEGCASYGSHSLVPKSTCVWVRGLGGWEGNSSKSRGVEDSIIREEDLPGWRN